MQSRHAGAINVARREVFVPTEHGVKDKLTSHRERSIKYKKDGLGPFKFVKQDERVIPERGERV